ncbi:MAG: DUF503 domain-containing protein [Candidatus Goldbacteria bacterium]|nr:DUF503 domain-containing protein [Candidatus Goldiibacteriota bacterium]HPD19565.1 DUF503 domain-containing protein [Candidatus Goldiibacteriota bacterium]
MKIGLLQAELYLSQCGSLKQKRFALSGLKSRLRNKFNVSIIEAAYQDKWQRAVIAIACISNDEKILSSTFNQILNFIEREKKGFEILNSQIEIL